MPKRQQPMLGNFFLLPFYQALCPTRPAAFCLSGQRDSSYITRPFVTTPADLCLRLRAVRWNFYVLWDCNGKLFYSDRMIFHYIHAMTYLTSLEDEETNRIMRRVTYMLGRSRCSRGFIVAESRARAIAREESPCQSCHVRHRSLGESSLWRRKFTIPGGHFRCVR